MLTNNDKRLMIVRFLSGEMDENEMSEFTSALEHDHELRLLLETESGTEGLLHDALRPPVTAMRYEQLVNGALGLADKGQLIIGNRLLRIYAIAATLLLMLSGGYIFINTFRGKDVPVPVAPYARHDAPVQKQRFGKSIMRLTPSTLLLAEDGTKTRIIRDADSAVNIVIAQGNACFDVAGNERFPIIVATPHTAITLNGSITRVVVTELETEVSVFEGSVEIVHRYNRNATRELRVGGSVFADINALQPSVALTPEVCESRASMFRAYIAWVRKQAHG